MEGLIYLAIVVVILAIIYFSVKKLFTNKWGEERGTIIYHYIFKVIGGIPLAISLGYCGASAEDGIAKLIFFVLCFVIVVSLIKGLKFCTKCKKFFAWVQEPDEFIEEVSRWEKRESYTTGNDQTKYKWVWYAKNRYLRRWHCANCDRTESKYVIKKEKLDEEDD